MFVFMQTHFKIAVTTLAVTLSSVQAEEKMNYLTTSELHEGWELLFDGKSMEKWKNYQKEGLSEKWVIQDGAMFKKPGGGDIVTKKSYKNFEFQCEWKISPKGNSGIFVRVDDSGKAVWSKSIEMQVLDNEEKTKSKEKAGSVFDLVAAPENVAKKAGEWNKVKILCEDKEMTFWLNGKKTANFTVGSDQWKELVAHSKFKGWQGFGLAESGPIGLQDHGNPVWFRNLKVREIKSK